MSSYQSLALMLMATSHMLSHPTFNSFNLPFFAVAQDSSEGESSANASAPSGPSCSCSPTKFQFQINLENTCNTTTTTNLTPDKVGISRTLCFIEVVPEGEDITGRSTGGVKRKMVRHQARKARSHDNEMFVFSSHNVLDRVDTTSHVRHASTFLNDRLRGKLRRRMQEEVGPTEDDLEPSEAEPDDITEPGSEAESEVESNVEPVEGSETESEGQDTIPIFLTSVLFLETDYTAEINVINQDSTYFDINLATGAILNFTSVSNELNVTQPLEDQLKYVPGGVLLVMFGVNEEEVVIQSTVAWGYDLNECEVEPIGVGDSIGWIEVDSFTPANPEFCPAIPVIGSKVETLTKSGKLTKGDPKAKSSKVEQLVAKSSKEKGSKTAKQAKDEEEEAYGTVDAKAQKISSSISKGGKLSKDQDESISMRGKAAKRYRRK